MKFRIPRSTNQLTMGLRGQATSDTGYEISTVVVSEAAIVLEFQR